MGVFVGGSEHEGYCFKMAVVQERELCVRENEQCLKQTYVHIFGGSELECTGASELTRDATALYGNFMECHDK